MGTTRTGASNVVPILIEHQIYAWWVITCPVPIVHILVEHLMYAWWLLLVPVLVVPILIETSDICLVG